MATGGAVPEDDVNTGVEREVGDGRPGDISLDDKRQLSSTPPISSGDGDDRDVDGREGGGQDSQDSHDREGDVDGSEGDVQSVGGDVAVVEGDVDRSRVAKAALEVVNPNP